MSDVWTLDELATLLRVPRLAIVHADRRTPHGVLSFTRIHNGYACHEALLPELRRALAQMPATRAAKRARMPRVQLRHKI
jgi:hypothetical protein